MRSDLAVVCRARRKDEEKDSWVVIYDFRGRKPNPRFWRNLRLLFALAGDGVMVQYGVFLTRRKRGAIAAVKIARHYGAEVMVFKGEETEFSL